MPLLRDIALDAARRHGLSAARVTRSPVQGAAATVWLLGDGLVLKIAHRDPALAADLRKEAVVIPYAAGLGVRTPEIVEFGDDSELPYLLLRRAPGAVPDGGEPSPAVHRELGGQLALLHGARPLPSLPGVPVDDAGGDPRPGVERLASEGYLSAGLADWLAGWFDDLAARIPAAPPEPVLIHGDVSALNLLVGGPDGGGLTALIDWGDAVVTDPAVEFAKVPPRGVADVLAGYGVRADEADVWWARVLWHHLSWAVPRLADPPRPQTAHWSAQPANRLLELLRHYAGLFPGAGSMRSQRLP
ncbi:phosphotransferase family protein [Streptomyces avicenniae]|uniref:phosphotransferase family protein n=1 Tax=Streptomyces avicenniae TaxID=500153 RepID=UPI00167F11FB|nr:aminoglycoside phosphotransferase family protein [Streptomyces avicenniae]